MQHRLDVRVHHTHLQWSGSNDRLGPHSIDNGHACSQISRECLDSGDTSAVLPTKERAPPLLEASLRTRRVPRGTLSGNVDHGSCLAQRDHRIARPRTVGAGDLEAAEAAVVTGEADMAMVTAEVMAVAAVAAKPGALVEGWGVVTLEVPEHLQGERSRNAQAPLRCSCSHHGGKSSSQHRHLSAQALRKREALLRCVQSQHIASASRT